MINLPNNLTKGQSLTFALNKELLIVAISDPYWSDSANIQKCIVIYKSKTGKNRQRKRLVFDFTQETPTASVEWSAKARNGFEIEGIVLVDFDNGSYTIPYSELPSGKDVSLGSGGDGEYKMAISGSNVFIKLDSKKYLVWGSNNYGSLGIGTTTPVSYPFVADYDYDFEIIDGGHLAANGNTVTSTAALEIGTGKALGWGRNYYGEIGDGTEIQKTSPTFATTEVQFSQISKGYTSNNGNSLSGYVLGIEKDTGLLYTWGTGGDNFTGALARTTGAHDVPTLADQASNLTFSKVYAAGDAIGITTSGAIYVWGGGFGGSNNVPVLVDDSRVYTDVIATETQITGTDRAAFAMDSDGKIYSWISYIDGSSNASGILGDGTTSSRSSLAEIEGGRTYSKMSCGRDHAAAIESGTNKLYMWGNNSNGQIGDGTTVNCLSPKLIASDKQFKDVICGDKCTIAIEFGTNDLYVWGDTSLNKLGMYYPGNILTPTLSLNLSTFVNLPPLTELIYEFNGVEGSTEFKDSLNIFRFFGYNSAAISTSDYKSGGSSLYLPSTPTTNSYVISHDSLYATDTSDFQVEMWVKIESWASALTPLIETLEPNGWGHRSNSFICSIQDNGGALRVWTNGGSFISVPNPIQLNTWAHFKMVRENLAFKIYVDDVLIANVSHPVSLTSQYMILGGLADGLNNTVAQYKGYIDDFKFKKL